MMDSEFRGGAALGQRGVDVDKYLTYYCEHLSRYKIRKAAVRM